MRRRELLSTSSGGGIDIDPTTGRGMIGKYEVVDLGLPSGLLWCTRSVGDYQWGAGDVAYQNAKQYHTGGTDSSYTLPSSADTATQKMGEGWRMPTKDECVELIDNTTYSWATMYSVVKGGKFTSKTNPSAYIFFRTSGYIRNGSVYLSGSGSFVWSSTPYYSSKAYALSCNSENNGVGNFDRNYGMCVYGVHAKV